MIIYFLSLNLFDKMLKNSQLTERQRNAINSDSVRSAQEFMRKGNINEHFMDGWRYLHMIADQGRPRLMRFALALGANINAKDRYGKTALDLVLDRMAKNLPNGAFTECLDILLRNSADPLTVDMREAEKFLGKEVLAKLQAAREEYQAMLRKEPTTRPQRTIPIPQNTFPQYRANLPSSL